jgi:hypothetical protein
MMTRTKTIEHLLTDKTAQRFAELVSFESLDFCPLDERVGAWAAVKTVALRTQDENQLNAWWRWVTPDAAWKTSQALMDFADWKIADIRDYQKTGAAKR